MLRDWLNNRRLQKAANLYEAGQVHEAGDLYVKASRSKDPLTAIQGALQTAVCAYTVGDLDRAETGLATFYRRFEELPGTGEWQDWHASAHAMHSSVHRYRRRFPEALQESTRAMDLHPTNDNRYVHAIALKNNGRLDEAIALLTKLVEADPIEYRLQLAGYLFLAGHTGLAEQIQHQISGDELREDPANAAWLAACRNDKADCCDHVQRSFKQISEFYLVSFYDNDVEFDRFRNDIEFVSLVRTRGRKR